ncbi:MAG TPA: DUF5677 domain-containing protein [Candidatus Limnocylindria bacterium]|nr:DUF5677 domain-containing protein [Candidatus Limnocylindria bacterium]
MTGKSDDEIIRAFAVFFEGMLAALRSAKARVPPERLQEIVAGALLSKVLRLGDAVHALCVGRHGNDTGLLLRTELLAYANLKFIAAHTNPEGAALRFMSHIRHVRGQIEPHLVRPDVEGEGFPVQTPEAWAEDEKELGERWDRIGQYVADNSIVELVPERPVDANGKRPKPLDWSWSGLSECELFAAIGDLDAYRYYAWFSNEVHSNVVGIGDLISQINEGRIDINDERDFTRGPPTMAAKYIVLSLEAYDALLKLGIAAKIEQTSDAFSAVIRGS